MCMCATLAVCVATLAVCVFVCATLCAVLHLVSDLF